MAEEQKERSLALYAGPTDRHAVLARYGAAKLVRIQAERIQMTDKSKYPLEWHEALLVGQASIATGLSPYEPQPELWYWIQMKHGERRLTIQRGRDGTIRLAEEAARRDGTYLLPPKFTQIVESREKIELGFGENDMVMMAQGFDHRSSDEYYARRRELKAEKMASAEIDARLGGEPPFDVGYGVITISERSQIEKKGSHKKYPHINRLTKRAHVSMLKKRWAAHINMHALADLAPMDDDAYAIEAEWQEVDVQGLKDVTPAGSDANSGVGTSGSDAGTLPSRFRKRPYPPKTVGEGVQIRLAKHKGSRKTDKYPSEPKMDYFEVASWQLSECFMDPKYDEIPTVQIVVEYLFGHESVDKITGAECRAALEWLDPKANGIGDLAPNALSVQEARLIVKEVLDGEEKEEA